MQVHLYKHDIGMEDWEESEPVVAKLKMDRTKLVAKEFEEATESEIPYLLDDMEETELEASKYEPRALFAGYRCIYMPSYKYFYAWK